MEGPDGSGKSTQIRRLRDYLEQLGFSVLQTREPGGTLIADKIRDLLLDPDHCELTPRAEALLYMASRAQHTAGLIRPALERGRVVISDRYADSTLVYQGVARGLPLAELAVLNRFATEGLMPDLTLLLDGDVETLESRMKHRGQKDRLDNEGLEFHQQVRSGFLILAAQEVERFQIVDANRGIDSVWADIEACVTDFLQKRGRLHATSHQ
jgi:dTMP kinase